MGKAGYCAECGMHVWLLEDGSCENGHSATSISGAYDTLPDPPPALPDAPAAKRKPLSRGVVIVVIVGVIALLVGLCTLAVVLAKPLLSKGTAVADEWQSRLAKDYPGWRPVGFNARTFAGADGSETTYSFTVIPPDRDFSVGVVYLSQNGGPPECQDEVFRPAGEYHDRSESLLDYVEQNYVDAGKTVTFVTSDPDGAATVNWEKVRRFGFFYLRNGSFDELAFDEDSDTWNVAFSPPGI